MDLEKIDNNSMIIKYQNTDNVVEDICFFLQFYKTFPNILHSTNAKSNILLSWTHYKTYLPTEEQLKAEIESQKAIFEIQ